MCSHGAQKFYFCISLGHDQEIFCLHYGLFRSNLKDLGLHVALVGPLFSVSLFVFDLSFGVVDVCITE